MANIKYLDHTGLQYFYGKLKTKFGELQTAVTAAQTTADNAAAEAAKHSSVSGEGYVTVTTGTNAKNGVNYAIDIPAAKLATSTTSSDADATLISTKGYVDTKMSAAEKTYSFGTDASFAKEEDSEVYKVTVDLYEQVGEADATKADSIVLSLNASEFVKDSFLQAATMGSGDKASTLILTMKLTDGTTKDIEVDLAQFIDTYTQGNGITISDHAISINTVTNGYLTASADGVDIDSEKVAKGSETGASTKLATQGYIDEKVAGLGTVVNSVAAEGSGFVSATATTEDGDVNIAVSLTTVDAANGGATGLATDAYVKEAVDAVSSSLVAITNDEIDAIVAG